MTHDIKGANHPDLSPRTIQVLKALKRLKSGGDRRDVADLMGLTREEVSPIFTRLERMKLIERCPTVLPGGGLTYKLTFRITKAGQQAIERGPSRAERLLNRESHGGAYGRVIPGSSPYGVAGPPVYNVMELPVYEPPKQTTARPGADDHKQFKSKGS